VEPAHLLPDEELRQLAREILERADYAAYRFDEDAWRRFWIRLDACLSELPGLLAQWRLDSPLLYWVFVGGLSLLALLLLAHVVWSVRAALRAPVPDSRRRHGRSARDLVAEAEALAGRGCLLEATRRVQRACLELLIAGGVLELERSDANRVLRRRLHQSPLPEELRLELVALVDRLEARLFRDRGEDRELYRAWRGLHGRLVSSGVA
jgi:hypothetical protein